MEVWEKINYLLEEKKMTKQEFAAKLFSLPTSSLGVCSSIPRFVVSEFILTFSMHSPSRSKREKGKGIGV